MRLKFTQVSTGHKKHTFDFVQGDGIVIVGDEERTLYAEKSPSPFVTLNPVKLRQLFIYEYTGAHSGKLTIAGIGMGWNIYHWGMYNRWGGYRASAFKDLDVYMDEIPTMIRSLTNLRGYEKQSETLRELCPFMFTYEGVDYSVEWAYGLYVLNIGKDKVFVLFT